MTSSTAAAGERTRTIARNSFWTTLDNLLGFIPHLVVSVAVARKLGPDKLGYFNYILWLTMIAGRLGLSGMGAATRKYAAEYLGRGDVAAANAIVRANLRHQFWVASGMSLLATALVLALAPREHWGFSVFATGSLFPLLLLVVFSSALNAAENLRANVATSMVSNAVNVAAVLALLQLGWGLTAVTFSLFASRMVDLFLKFLQFRRHFPKPYDPAPPAIAPAPAAPGTLASEPEPGEAALRSAGPTVPLPLDDRLRYRMNRFYWLATLLLVLDIVVWDRSELLILKWHSSIRQLAFYSLAFNIAAQLLTVPQMIAASAGASLMVQYGRDSRQTGALAATSMRYICLLAFPGLLGLAAVGGSLLQLLYGMRYAEAAPVLVWLAVLSIPRTLIAPAQQQILAFERQSFLLGWGVAMAAVNIGLDFLLIRPYGALGAAWANGLAQSLAASGIVWYAVRRLGTPVNFGNLGRILAASVLMAAPVAIVARLLPPVPGLLLGVPAGALLYLAGLRLTGALLEEDYQRFALFLHRLPTRWRPAAARVLRTLIVQPTGPAL